MSCAGLPGDANIIPAISCKGELLPASLTSAEVTRWLRSILAEQDGAEPDNILCISSHSLKATTLSWCAKVSVPLDSRTLLGYHSLGVNRSALNYSRDALAGPLRDLARVIGLIRTNQFNPDDTRSGRWRVQPVSWTEVSEDTLRSTLVVESPSPSGECSLAASAALRLNNWLCRNAATVWPSS